jgi:flagellar hook-basal body complex protein FliE
LGDFLSTISQALGATSQDQAAASDAENGVAAGKPGASMASALVLSDRAELAWNAVVAVRNEVVSAYQSVMNMTI